MAGIKIELPDFFHFTTTIAVRITDLNYGGHVGNDTVLSIIHEARMQFLLHFGYSEMNLAGVGIIMRDVAIEFKQELFYGDKVQVSVAVADMSKVSFVLYYKLEKEKSGAMLLAAAARTGMVCYNYEAKKIAVLPDEARRQFNR